MDKIGFSYRMIGVTDIPQESVFSRLAKSDPESDIMGQMLEERHLFCEEIEGIGLADRVKQAATWRHKIQRDLKKSENCALILAFCPDLNERRKAASEITKSDMERDIAMFWGMNIKNYDVWITTAYRCSDDAFYDVRSRLFDAVADLWESGIEKARRVEL